MLNCSAIQNESYQTQNQSYPHLNHRPMTFNFVHHDNGHLGGNLLSLIRYGFPLEVIIGTPTFIALYSYLCLSISLEWYDTQLALNTCATADPIVGASGVTAALGPYAVIIKLYRLCFKVIVKYFSGSKNQIINENKKTSFISIDFILLGIDLFSSLILGLYVLVQFLNDKFYPKDGVPNDLHLLGFQKGSFLLIFGVPYCLFWDLLGPIFRMGYEKLREKILIALPKMLEWFPKCCPKQKCEPASRVQNSELGEIELKRNIVINQPR